MAAKLYGLSDVIDIGVKIIFLPYRKEIMCQRSVFDLLLKNGCPIFFQNKLPEDEGRE